MTPAAGVAAAAALQPHRWRRGQTAACCGPRQAPLARAAGVRRAGIRALCGCRHPSPDGCLLVCARVPFLHMLTCLPQSNSWPPLAPLAITKIA